MKNLELSNFGVVEMNSDEIKVAEGGILPLLIAGAAFLVEFGCYAAAGDIILNFNSYASSIKAKTHGGASGSW